jgi:hypothetical protein
MANRFLTSYMFLLFYLPHHHLLLLFLLLLKYSTMTTTVIKQCILFVAIQYLFSSLVKHKTENTHIKHVIKAAVRLQCCACANISPLPPDEGVNGDYTVVCVVISSLHTDKPTQPRDLAARSWGLGRPWTWLQCGGPASRGSPVEASVLSVCTGRMAERLTGVFTGVESVTDGAPSHNLNCMWFR